MANVTLTDNQVIEVRMQVGTDVTESELSDAQITSDTTLGSACDYVYEKVREGIDLSKLTEQERTIAQRARDETPDDLTNFVNTILKPPQRTQFSRAIIFRTAGMCATIVKRLESETASGITKRIQERKALELRNVLFESADAEIERLRQAFPDDAFPTDSERILPKYNLFTTTGS